MNAAITWCQLMLDTVAGSDLSPVISDLMR